VQCCALGEAPVLIDGSALEVELKCAILTAPLFPKPPKPAHIFHGGGGVYKIPLTLALQKCLIILLPFKPGQISSAGQRRFQGPISDLTISSIAVWAAGYKDMDRFAWRNHTSKKSLSILGDYEGHKPRGAASKREKSCEEPSGCSLQLGQSVLWRQIG
jgi:hypothetical protein